MVQNKQALIELTDNNKRIDIALELLVKASTGGLLQAKFSAYDLVNSLALPSVQQYEVKFKLIKEFKNMENDSAAIRVLEDSLLTMNPLENIKNGLNGKNKADCAKVILFSQRQNFSFIEKQYLTKMLNSPNCKNSN